MPEPGHDESTSAQVVNRSGREIRWDALAAIVASLVGLLALLVAGYTAYVERQQVRAQVWPYLQMSRSNAAGHFEIDAYNRGVGPVIVKSVQVQAGDKPVNGWNALFEVTGFKPAGAVLTSTLNQTVIAPGGQVRWVVFDNRADVEEFTRVSDAHHVVARICYASTLGQTWLVVVAPDVSLTPREVSGCPQSRQADAFND